jgi:hypothetical protein
VNNVVEIKVESKKQKIPMKKGKLIQPLLLLPLLKLCASFEDAASLSSIVVPHFLCIFKNCVMLFL